MSASLRRFPRVEFIPWVTPLELQPRLSAELGIEIIVKRDDLNGLALGGNKVRQLEYYFGQARAENADTALITGAVQSNFTRITAACAARLGMHCHVQLEERVPDVDNIYRSSGNVLLEQLLGATISTFPEGENEAGADAELERHADEFRKAGKRPYVIHLSANHPPLGALGYVRCADEILAQSRDIDVVVVGSGSGATHAGLLFGLRASGWTKPVLGICVRRNAQAQKERVFATCQRLASLLGIANAVKIDDVETFDDWLAPGYGTLNAGVSEAIRMCARLDGLLVDPVYTGRVMAGVIGLARSARLARESAAVIVHTGGLPAIFGYESELRNWRLDRPD